MPKMTAKEIISKVNRKLDALNAPLPERVAKLMTYQAAIHALTGRAVGELDPADEADDVDTDELEEYADKLRDLGIENYARRAYGGEDPKKAELNAMKYDYFLYQTAELLGIEDATHRAALKEELRGKLLAQEGAGEVSCIDTWLHKKQEQDEARREPLKEEDRSVYEFEASDGVWRDYVAGGFCYANRGAVKLTDQIVAAFKESPFHKLTLRNKQTVEHVKRGELKAIAGALQRTEGSFTFLRAEDLKEAQKEALALNRQMQDVDPAIARDPAWRSLSSAVFAFQTAEDPKKAAKASAEVLLAVEKFTKGKKNANQKAEVTQGVNLALKALGTTIPNAAANPSVTPLVDRFNDVRRHRLQSDRLVTLRGNKALTAASTDREVTAFWKAKMDAFVEGELKRPTVQNGVATVTNEDQAREAMAIALAIEEAREGRINVKQEMEKRIEALKEDPIVKALAHGAATDRAKASELAANTGSFSFYLKTDYDQTVRANRQKEEQSFEDELSRQQEQIRKQTEELQRKERERKESREEKEQRFRKELLEREVRLDTELEELGVGIYGVGDGDPEKTKELFAEMIATREFRECEKLGIDPKNDLKERIEALKNDKTVAEMAEKLPDDEDFRRIVKRGVGGADALHKAYANGGELPEELCRMTVGELYADHREAVERLAGTRPAATEYSADKATLLLANLMTLRELELKGGGDAKVNITEFYRRVNELQKDQQIRNLAEGLTSPQGKAELKKLVSDADEPERLLAENLHKGYQVAQPEKQAQEQPKAPIERKEEGPVIVSP